MVQPSNSGTAANSIRFVADTDGTETGDAGVVAVSAASGPAFKIHGKDYIQVIGFRAYDSTYGIEWRDSVGGLIKDCEAYGSDQQGIKVHNS